MSEASPDCGPDALTGLYEEAPCGLVSLDPSGRIARVNATFSRWIGFESQELLGRKLHGLLNVAGRIFYETHLSPLLRMQGVFNEVALEFVRKDGVKMPVIANANENRGADGVLLSTRLAFFLATNRQQYERDLLVARATAEKGLQAVKEVSELREQFIAVLGHDLRNPLASIIGGIRLLAREIVTPRGNQVVTHMQDAAMRMSGLIDDVLDFARGRLGGGIGISLAEEPLVPLLQQVVMELRTAQPAVTVETRFFIAAPVLCDRRRIGQLVSNLLGNAVTHGASNEPVILHAETAAEELVLWVSNSGPPIPEAAMQRLFQPFFRGEVRSSAQGLGLGLHIASEIAKAHGGTLTVASTEVETRFTLRMPRVPSSL